MLDNVYPYYVFHDVSKLNPALPGKAYQFGHEDEHHLYLFHLDRPFDAAPEDMTLEVLMYGIDPEVRPAFSLGVARAVRKKQPSITTVHYVLPSVWAQSWSRAARNCGSSLPAEKLR